MILYSYLPEFVNLVDKEFLTLGQFCYYLIRSMKVQTLRQENWIQKIQKNIEEK